MAPIYSYLGASEASLPLLQLAGPMTGRLAQPLIGAMSDRTDSRWGGRRTPYFLIGALLCAAGLFFMPLSSSLLMAVPMLWILDAGNNITMEPYRGYVSDRLNEDQHQIGFLTQSAFTGLTQMLAFLTPSLLVWAGMNQDWVDAHNIPYTAWIAFMVGAVLSFGTILWSIRRVPELPLSVEESDLLIRDLTSHRTMGLRLALGEQPDMALIAVTHALAAQTFYRGVDAACLEIRPTSSFLASHADGIEDTAAGKALADRHAGWAADMPRDVADLWGFIAGLDHASVRVLFAHCASLTVNAVKQPWERKPHAHATAEKLAMAVALDMTAHWTPTVRTYLGRVTKAHMESALVGRRGGLRHAPKMPAEALARTETGALAHDFER